jgi:hypothetical protein
MKNEIIKLVSENFETIKHNKIDFEIKLLRECATRLNATNDALENEISKIKGLFNHCSTAEDVLDTICEKDFCCGYEDWLYEDLLGNIKGLIKE